MEGIHYRTRKPIRLAMEKGIIARLSEVDQVLDGTSDQDSDQGGKLQGRPHILAPGLVDLQINGFKGVDFIDSDLQPEQIEAISKDLINTGVSTYYPTIITGPVERTSLLIKTFTEAIKQKGLASEMIGGIHLEGPFISKEDGPRGAHPKAHCLEPDLKLLEQWQELAGGMIKILTLAPELPGSEE